MFVAGPPRGAQAVFDRALQAAFGGSLDQTQPGAEVIEIGRPGTLEETFSKRLLGLMTRQAAGRQMMNGKVTLELLGPLHCTLIWLGLPGQISWEILQPHLNPSHSLCTP